jgi:hypothetical protein
MDQATQDRQSLLLQQIRANARRNLPKRINQWVEDSTRKDQIEYVQDALTFTDAGQQSIAIKG